MGLKENCKLVSQVLKTRVPYQSRASETCFPLAEFVELDMVMHTQISSFLHSISNREQKMYKPRKRRKNPKKERTQEKKKNDDLRRRQEPTEDLKKERRDAGQAIWLEKNNGWSDEEEHQRRWAIWLEKNTRWSDEEEHQRQRRTQNTNKHKKEEEK